MTSLLHAQGVGDDHNVIEVDQKVIDGLSDGGDPVSHVKGAGDDHDVITLLKLTRKPLKRMFQIFTLTPFVIFSQSKAVKVDHSANFDVFFKFSCQPFD